MSRRDVLVALAVPVVALLVAGGQLATSLSGELTPWRGGGFGMFSTLDGFHERRLEVVLVDVRGAEIEMAAGQADGWRQTTAYRANPTSGNADRLAAKLLAARWTLDDGVARLAPGGAWVPAGVRLEVSRPQMDDGRRVRTVDVAGHDR
jgi:hypothetical protein